MKRFVFIVLLLGMLTHLYGQEKYLDKEGYISFFSEAPVEDIKAQNNQVLALLDFDENELKVQLLVKSFLFEKALMREHFNENYMESHKYPKATFIGQVAGLDQIGQDQSPVEIKGFLKIKNSEKQLQLKAVLNRTNNVVFLKGTFVVAVSDFDIKIPMSVVNNIAEELTIDFEFQLKPY